jgi:hypothetical protein
MARTKQTCRKSTGGKAPMKSLVTQPSTLMFSLNTQISQKITPIQVNDFNTENATQFVENDNQEVFFPAVKRKGGKGLGKGGYKKNFKQKKKKKFEEQTYGEEFYEPEKQQITFGEEQTYGEEFYEPTEQKQITFGEDEIMEEKPITTNYNNNIFEKNEIKLQPPSNELILSLHLLDMTKTELLLMFERIIKKCNNEKKDLIKKEIFNILKTRNEK